MRAWRFLIPLLFSGFAFCCAATADAPSPQNQAPQSSAARYEKAFDDLLARLHQAPDAKAAARIRSVIDRLLRRSGSPTADLLMSRAESLLNSGQAEGAAALLDRIVTLYPDWSLGWRRRAQSAVMQGDRQGAMLDLDHALAIEPRNFMAMGELANILRAEGRNAPALELLRRELELDPQNLDVRREAEKLEREIEGERI